MEGEYIFLHVDAVSGNEVMLIPPQVTKIKKKKIHKIIKTIGNLMLKQFLPIIWQ